MHDKFVKLVNDAMGKDPFQNHFELALKLSIKCWDIVAIWLFGPCIKKTCLRGFRPCKTQFNESRLFSYRDQLEYWNFVLSNSIWKKVRYNNLFYFMLHKIYVWIFQLLSYAATTLLFSDKKVDTNIISWNKVVLLHGECLKIKTVKGFLRHSHSIMLWKLCYKGPNKSAHLMQLGPGLVAQSVISRKSDFRPRRREFDLVPNRHILPWGLIVKCFLQSFSSFRWFKKGCYQLNTKVCAHSTG